LFYQLRKHSFSLLVGIDKVVVKPAAHKKGGIERTPVLFEIPKSALSPNAYGS
jgi:hypothetical protein